MAAQEVSAPPTSIRYVPALDGLRGLSLPGTIFTHFAIFFTFYKPGSPTWLRYAGPFTLNIEMFFVLSGALITYMLVSEHGRTGAVSLKTFYLRRSRRLGPALIAVVPLLLVAQHFVHWKGLEPLGESPWITVLCLLLFVGNWRMSGGETGLGWIGPAWTLGIEEQFYLTWPTILILSLRRVSRRALMTGMAVTIVACTAFSAVISRSVGISRTGYMTPTHVPPLLLGCALGYWLATTPDGALVRLLRRQVVAVAGLAGMVVISLHWHGDRLALDSGGYVLYSAASCLLIGHLFVVGDRPSAVSRALAWRPLVIIGQVSYEAYLVHCIVILFVLHTYPSLSVPQMIVLDTFLIAAISGAFYYGIEQPIRRKGWGVLVGRLVEKPVRAPVG